MKKRIHIGFSGLERKIIACLTLIFFLSNIGVIRAFYVENSSLQPTQGGSFVEGAVGSMSQTYDFNPLFAEGIEADISNLIFAGLMKYNAETGEISDHLATHTLSPNKQVYEFTLHDNLLWHDGQPVTADDVIFTYKDVIQHEDFSNLFLKQAFADVTIEKIDDKTVRFTIPEMRKTFFTNFTIGLIPKHLLEQTPVANLQLDSFGQAPIGCGPYRFEGIFREIEFTEIRLSAFSDAFGGAPKIESIYMKVFGKLDDLVTNISTLDAIRPLRTEEMRGVPDNSRFEKIELIGPRYVAVFFNLKDEKLAPKKIRQAMRASIDTNAMAEEFFGERVDTPFVELWPQNDVIKISMARAGELMNESGFFFPDEQGFTDQATVPKATATPVATPNPALEEAKYVYEPSDKKWSATSSDKFYLVGFVPDNTSSVSVNGYQLQLFKPTTGRFSYLADHSIGTLKTGENTFRVEFKDRSGKVLDSESVMIHFDADQSRVDALLKSKLPPTEVSPEPEEIQIIPETTPKPQGKYRINKNGNHVTFSLTYLKSFDYLENVTASLVKQWQEMGIEIITNPLDPDQFREALRTHNYELILLPQHLGYNLDSYPYFHLSQVNEGGFNVAGWKNLKASVLLEEIRSTHDAEKRVDSLSQLRDIFIEDVPAIMLFTPKYTWLVDKRIKNVNVNHMAVLSDRYSLMNTFYVRESREFSDNKSVSGFFPWFWKQSKSLFSFS